jgi:hypothetical protein
MEIASRMATAQKKNYCFQVVVDTRNWIPFEETVKILMAMLVTDLNYDLRLMRDSWLS